MKVLKLILRNCDRFLLNQIKEIVYTPDSPYQLITGNNGSGKSSLLEEISPLPPDKNKFTKNGYKEIHIEHEGKHYILKSDFSKTSSGTHSFVCNDEELNDGQNVTMQLQLVKEHFKYTKEIHELVIGKRLFTQMTGLQRRDWFVKIANVDMDYIMDLFNRVKSAHRDNQGAIKLQEKRLASSLEQLPTEDKQKELENESLDYKQALDVLDRFLPKEFERYVDIEQRLNKILDKIEKLRTPEPGLSFEIQHPFKGKGLENLKFGLESVSSLVHYKQEELNQQLRRQQELTEKLSKLEWNDTMTDEMIQDELDAIQKELDTIKIDYVFNGDIEETIRIAETIKNDFEMWCAEAPTNPDGRFDEEKYREKLNMFTALDSRKIRIESNIQQIRDNIQHIETSKFQTTCPCCQNTIAVAHNMEKLPKMKDKILEGELIIVSIEKDLAPIKEYLKEHSRWKASIEHCRKNFIYPYPQLRFFFDSLLTANFFDTPLVAVGKLDVTIQTLRLTKRQRELNDRQLYLIDLLNRRRGSDAVKLKGSLELAEEGISKIQTEIKALQLEERERQVHYEKARRLLQTYDEMTQSFELFEETLSKLYDSIGYEEASLLKNELLHEYRLVSESLSEAKTKRRVIEDIKAYLNELTARETSYKMLIDVLNPNDGLIAKSLLGFINHFLDQFNGLIGHIWSYDMKIVAEDSADFTKNYNFPLKQANKENPSSDVRESSKGQREMVDFAFLMLVMRYLGLEHFPLLLDELGGGFTEEHRIHILNYLKQMVETGQIEQMFLISHNSSSHDTLNLADVICFDTDGVMQDERVNRVIKFN